MCVTPQSEFFWIGLALLVTVAAAAIRTGWRFVTDLRRAGDAEAAAQAIRDHANALLVTSLWLMIVLIAAGACGLPLL